MSGTQRRTSADRWLTPPDVPPEFWEHPPLVEALAAGHMGRVLRAYRSNPWHGPWPLSQAMVAGWLGMEQGRVSKAETGPTPQKIDWLRFVARTLRIPAARLWFALEPGGELVRPDADGCERPEPNQKLKAARLRLRSPSDPGMRMSRRDVADAVNAYLAAHDLPPLYLDQTYIGKLERGMVRWPRTNLRRALRSVLGAACDSDLGFWPSQRGDTERLDDNEAAAPVPGDTAPSVTAPAAGLAMPPPALGLDRVTVSVDTNEQGGVLVTVTVTSSVEEAAQEPPSTGAAVYSMAQARSARSTRAGRLA